MKSRQDIEQNDPITREFLALPMDKDGVVDPEFRARAAELRKIMLAREQGQSVPLSVKRFNPYRKARTMSGVSDTIEEIVSLLAERKQCAARMEDIDREIAKTMKGNELDLGAGLKLVVGKVKKARGPYKKTETGADVHDISAGGGEEQQPKKVGVTNEILDLLEDGKALSRLDIAATLDGFSPHQISAALMQAVRSGVLECIDGSYRMKKAA